MDKKIVSRIMNCKDTFSDEILSAYISMRNSLASKMRCNRGASTVEYALVIGVIVLMIVGAAMVMEGPLKDFFKGIIDKIKGFAGV